jgi:hypothetical protein
MFGKKSIKEEYQKALLEIEEGQRRRPQHDHPMGPRGKYSPGDVDAVDQHFFEQASLLGPTLDWHTADAWSFEETSDTMRRAWYIDSPDYGRRWIIYYNGLKMGWMEASASPERLFGTVDDFTKSPKAQIDIELHDARWVPADNMLGLLFQAAFLMQGTKEGGYDGARDRARREAESAMTLYSWEVMRAGDEYVPSMEFSSEGSYAVYRETIGHWKESGFDVLTKALEGKAR